MPPARAIRYNVLVPRTISAPIPIASGDRDEEQSETPRRRGSKTWVRIYPQKTTLTILNSSNGLKNSGTYAENVENMWKTKMLHVEHKQKTLVYLYQQKQKTMPKYTITAKAIRISDQKPILVCVDIETYCLSKAIIKGKEKLKNLKHYEEIRVIKGEELFI